LPFLLPAAASPSSPAAPVSAASLLSYAKAHGTIATEPLPPRHQTYQSLLDNPIRAAWLHSLYLSPANAKLLDELYLRQASSSAAVRAVIHAQLRRAASDEIARCLGAGTASSGLFIIGVDVGLGLTPPPTAVDATAEIYPAAAGAFDALAVLLRESTTGWFFGADRPGLFDAAVFAYTQLLLEDRQEVGGLNWEDRRLGDLVRAAGGGAGELVRHRESMWEML
jgi:metaxin